jgi:O-6-methylguanine DNA methyltransferase
MRVNSKYKENPFNLLPIKYLLSFPDIKYCAYPFPTGRLYIFGDKNSLKMILFGYDINHKNDVEKYFNEGGSGAIDKAIKFLDNYLMGKESPLPELDMVPFTRKEIRIYNNLTKIPFGKTVTYNGLAKKSGIPHGARFVGNAMAKNFFPILIPCHRVIKSDGNIGNYSSGIKTKMFLLEHEKAVFKK